MRERKKGKIIICDICETLLQQNSPTQRRHLKCRKEYYVRYHKQMFDTKKGAEEGENRLIRHTDLVINRTENTDRQYRECLKCGGQFESESKTNRICHYCTIANNSYSGMTGAIIKTGGKRSGGD